MSQTKKEIIAELKALKIAFNENDKIAVLEKLLDNNKGASPEVSVTGKVKTDGKKVLVWLKNKAYINEKQRVKAGLYLLDECPERLSKLPATVCEVLDTEVNSRKIVEIAKFAGFDPVGLSDEEILSKAIAPEFKIIS